MKVLVCGSRSWNWPGWIRRRLLDLPPGSEVIHGVARKGADIQVHRFCLELGIPVTPFPANWKLYGNKAGIIRNLEMLDQKPDLVIAFWDGESRGTKHTIDEAQRRGIKTEIIKCLPRS